MEGDRHWQMKLLNADKAIIPPEKLRDYLLSPSHPVGKFKAAYFRTLGYTCGDWEQLEADIRIILGHDVQLREHTRYGQKFEVRGFITTPSLRTAFIVTAWIILNNENIPRFITAYPRDLT
jgi:hypothetical protein